MTDHLEDGALIRLIDGEASAQERTAVEMHTVDCAACASRLAELRRLGTSLSTALTAADVSPRRFVYPPVSRRSRRSRIPLSGAAAAILLVVATIAAAATPVRAWLHARWVELRGATSRQHASAPPAPQNAKPTTVRFAPRDASFTIELTGPQSGGMLTVDVSEDSIATAVWSGRSGEGEELVVLPMGLKIVNHTSTVASYVVRLPRTITQVTVHVGSGPAHRLNRLTDRRWTLDLNSAMSEPH